MIEIDGAMGEGGGQVLRSSLSLSLCLGRPFRIVNIRKARRIPGLRPQHLAAVRASAEIGTADVEGAAIDSTTLSFVPKRVTAGSRVFDIGTAGSCTLVLQTILPPLVTSGDPSKLVLEGGTHNPNAPPFDFLHLAFLPLLDRMGPRVSAALDRYGFYPEGGGRITIEIKPAPRLRGLVISERGKTLSVRAIATVVNLPKHIGQRELVVIGEALGLGEQDLTLHEVWHATCHGNVVTIIVKSEQITEVFTGFGQRGVRAEVVASNVAKAAQRYLEAGAPVGVHLADQILLPLALAGSGSFVTLRPSSHMLTNIAVIKKFMAVDIESQRLSSDAWRISVSS